MEATKKLTITETEKITGLIEEYRKVYTEASKIGSQIESLQGEMLKISAKMKNISNKENHLYEEIAQRIGISVEDAREAILKEIQENLNKAKTI